MSRKMPHQDFSVNRNPNPTKSQKGCGTGSELMHPLIQDKLAALADLCAKNHVRRLALFGSATGPHFNPASSDLDVLVEFQPMPPAEHADSYFGLIEDLQRLFGRPVDLIEPGSLRNPYLLEAIRASQVILYDAA
jgi:predicted nucleotidyltransferase